MSQIVLAYIAGLVTILSPCVLPMLPIILSGALNTHRLGPIALASGLVVSFTAIGLLIATLGFSIGLTPSAMTNIGAGLMLTFGVILLSTNLRTQFAIASESALSGLNTKVATFSPQTLAGQATLGVLLGAVWTPCVGPTLGAAIALAAQGENITRAALIMFVFALGTVTPLVALMYGTREAISSRKKTMAQSAAWITPVLAVLLILVSLMIMSGVMTQWEDTLLKLMPKGLVNFIYQF